MLDFCPFCHPTTDVQVLKETHSSDPQPGKITHWLASIHQLTPDRRNVTPITLASNVSSRIKNWKERQLFYDLFQESLGKPIPKR